MDDAVLLVTELDDDVIVVVKIGCSSSAVFLINLNGVDIVQF